MHDSLFIYSFGSNIFDTLGYLNRIKEEISETVIWNLLGSSSLIVFFKILGYNFVQTFEKLREIELVESFYNYSSLLPEDESGKIKTVKNFLEEEIDFSSLINTETTLKEVYKLTNIFSNFILNTEEEGIKAVNPKTFPDIKLVDCIICSLTGLGTFKKYQVEGFTFINSTSVSPFPEDFFFKLEKKKLRNFSIVNITEVFELEDNPLINSEKELLNQEKCRNLSLIENKESVHKITSILKKKLSQKEKESRFNNDFDN